MYNKEINQFEGRIYCIVSKANGKEYIGQTTRPLEERINNHLKESVYQKTNMIIDKAIAKYGWENFVYYEIEYIHSSTEEGLNLLLNEKEQYYIKIKNTISPNGYNLTKGGQILSNSHYCSVDIYTFDGVKIDSCQSYREASEKYNVPYRSIQNVAYGKQGCYESGDKCYVFRNVGDCFDKYPLYKKQRKIYQFDKSGNLLNSYYGSINAAKELQKYFPNSELDTIRTCIDRAIRQHSSSKGYFWSLENTFNIDEYYRRTFKYKRILRYDKDTKEFIKSYNTFSEAAIDVTSNIHNCSPIQKCCDGKMGYCFSSIWRYEGDKIDKFPLHIERLSKGIMINQYKDDIFIKTYQSITDASEENGFKYTSNISSALKSKSHISHGYKWYYANDLDQPDKTKIINTEINQEEVS